MIMRSKGLKAWLSNQVNRCFVGSGFICRALATIFRPSGEQQSRGSWWASDPALTPLSTVTPGVLLGFGLGLARS
jgi:hypothetical protein